MTVEASNPEPKSGNLFDPIEWDKFPVSDRKLENVSLSVKEWKDSKFLIDKYVSDVEKAEKISNPADVEVARAIGYLLQKISQKDREITVLADLDSLFMLNGNNITLALSEFNKARKEWDLSQDEFQRLYENWINRKFRMLSLEDPTSYTPDKKGIQKTSSDHIRYPELQDERDYRRVAYLYHFSNIILHSVELKNSESQLTTLPKEINISRVEMQPVHDGVINYIAYPLRSLKIYSFNELPIMSDFEEQVQMLRSNELDVEARHHPEIMDTLKMKFARIVRLYADDTKAFEEDRSVHGNGKITRLLDDYYQYIIETYIPEHLDKNTLRLFRLEYGNRHYVKNTIRLQILAETIGQDDPFFIQKEYHSNKYLKKVRRLISSIKNGLVQMGATFDENGVSNLDELLEKQLVDKNIREMITKTWEDVRSICHDRSETSLSIDDLDNWASNYLYDYKNEILARYLRIIRNATNFAVLD